MHLRRGRHGYGARRVHHPRGQTDRFNNPQPQPRCRPQLRGRKGGFCSCGRRLYSKGERPLARTDDGQIRRHLSHDQTARQCKNRGISFGLSRRRGRYMHHPERSARALHSRCHGRGQHSRLRRVVGRDLCRARLRAFNFLARRHDLFGRLALRQKRQSFARLALSRLCGQGGG